MTGGEKQSVRGRRDQPSRSLLGSLSGSEDGMAPVLPPEEREALNAKMFLMTTSDPDEPSLYEHMSKLIADVLDKKHDDTMTLFEHISKFMKMERIHIPTLSLRNSVQQTHTETLASAQWNLLEKSKKNVETQAFEIHDGETEEAKFLGVPDIMRHAAYFEMAGVGVPREEFVRIALSLNDLINAYPTIQHIRFWGKMFGTQKNYYVAETELSEHELEEDPDVMQIVHGVTSTSNKTQHEEEQEFEDEDSTLFDDIILPEDLKPMFKPPPKIPCEPAGTGLNKKVYFVTHEPGLTWTRLPHVTPAQIQVARQIRKVFTGDLESAVVSYPPFPGVERNYLRAQIARISASTHVSPLGYFRFDDEGEEEEEALGEEGGAGRDNIMSDSEFEGIAHKDLADGSLQAWVHHNPAILPQGRTTWWNPAQPKEDFNEEEENEEEEEERQEPDEPEPEVGPPMLSPLAEDESIGFVPAWFASTSSKFVPEYSVAVLQSNVWIGAVAFAAEKGKFFENLYIGWGQKNLGNDFEPAVPENPLDEFPSGPEITEADDPTPEEEAAVRAAQQEKELEAEFEQNIQDDDDDDIVDDDGEGGDQFDED